MSFPPKPSLWKIFRGHGGTRRFQRNRVVLGLVATSNRILGTQWRQELYLNLRAFLSAQFFVTVARDGMRHRQRVCGFRLIFNAHGES
jgi:hypothetical protein